MNSHTIPIGGIYSNHLKIPVYTDTFSFENAHILMRLGLPSGRWAYGNLKEIMEFLMLLEYIIVCSKILNCSVIQRHDGFTPKTDSCSTIIRSTWDFQCTIRARNRSSNANLIIIHRKERHRQSGWSLNTCRACINYHFTSGYDLQSSYSSDLMRTAEYATKTVVSMQIDRCVSVL